MQGNQRQTHWAYIAGIMDADGCFMIMKQNRKTNRKISERALKMPKIKSSWVPYYSARIKIAMIEEEAIKFITEELGFGKYRLDGALKDRIDSKPIFHWYIDERKQTIDFIKNVMPFLKVKKNRAEHVLSFCNHMELCSQPGYRGVSENELDYRESSYWKMRKMNGSKVAATTKPTDIREDEAIV
jgi:hypothetical protein